MILNFSFFCLHILSLESLKNYAAIQIIFLNWDSLSQPQNIENKLIFSVFIKECSYQHCFHHRMKMYSLRAMQWLIDFILLFCWNPFLFSFKGELHSSCFLSHSIILNVTCNNHSCLTNRTFFLFVISYSNAIFKTKVKGIMWRLDFIINLTHSKLPRKRVSTRNCLDHIDLCVRSWKILLILLAKVGKPNGSVWFPMLKSWIVHEWQGHKHSCIHFPLCFWLWIWLDDSSYCCLDFMAMMDYNLEL